MGVLSARHPDLDRVCVVEFRSMMKQISMNDIKIWNNDWEERSGTLSHE